MFGTVVVNHEVVWHGRVDLEVEKMEKNGAVVAGNGSGGEQPYEGFVLHWDGPGWCLIDDEGLVDLSQGFKEWDRVEMRAVCKNSRRLGPFDSLETGAHTVRANTFPVILW